jgi:hypothetical protein
MFHKIAPGDVFEVKQADAESSYFICICESYDFFLQLRADIPFDHASCTVHELSAAQVAGNVVVDLRSLMKIPRVALQAAISRQGAVKATLSVGARRAIVSAVRNARTLSESEKAYVESRLSEIGDEPASNEES